MVIDIFYGFVNCAKVIGVSERMDYGEIIVGDIPNAIDIGDVGIHIRYP